MKSLFVPVLLLVLVGALGAQNYVAYPMDCLHGYRGQVIPLGASTSTNFDESRTQHLIPAQYLPSAGGDIIGFDVSPHVTGTVPYKALTVSMGHTLATVLSTTFAANLPNPTLVLAIKALKMNYPSKTAWDTINFNSPFKYDGNSNLIIEVQKEIDRTASPSTVSHQTTNYPARTDIPRPLFAYGAGGSGQVNAATGSLFSDSSRIMWRLRVLNSATVSIASTRSSTSQDFFHLSAKVTLTVQANANDVYVNTIDFALRPSPGTIPGLQGAYWLPSLFNIIWIGVVPASGRGDMPLIIPNVSALVGKHVYFQSAALGAILQLTNVTDCIIAP